MHLPKVEEILLCSVSWHLKINTVTSEEVEKIAPPAALAALLSVCCPEALPGVETLNGSQIRLNAFLAVKQDGNSWSEFPCNIINFFQLFLPKAMTERKTRNKAALLACSIL